MKVLIVEDDENKRSQLSHFVHNLIPEAEIETAKSLQSGVRRMRQSPADLVLLDMTLPNYDVGPGESGGQQHPLGGRQFLSQMERFEINVPVIVVTQFEKFGKGSDAMNLHDLDAELRSGYNDIYLGAVYYHAAILGWQQRLETLIRQCAGAGGRR